MKMKILVKFPSTLYQHDHISVSVAAEVSYSYSSCSLTLVLHQPLAETFRYEGSQLVQFPSIKAWTDGVGHDNIIFSKFANKGKKRYVNYRTGTSD